MRLEYPYIQLSVQNAILPELKHSTLAFKFVGSNALSLSCLPLKHNGFTIVTYLERVL